MLQGKIAKEISVNRGFVSTIENGKTNPALSVIIKIAKVRGVLSGKFLR